MSQYYYTVAALPLIFYETEIQEDTVDQFLSFCRAWLSPGDMKLLYTADYSAVKEAVYDHPLLCSWQKWEISLKNALVELRAAKKGDDPYKYTVENETVLGMDELSREAFAQESPLIGEEVLNRGRWSYIDELETGHYFDIEKILCHYLKLQILVRKMKFRNEAGLKKYEELFEKLTDYDVHAAMKAG